MWDFLREMPKYQTDIALIPRQHELDRGCRLAAAWTFEVPVLDHGDATITRSPDVIRAVDIEQG
jgi:hypothetical protein